MSCKLTHPGCDVCSPLQKENLPPGNGLAVPTAFKLAGYPHSVGTPRSQVHSAQTKQVSSQWATAAQPTPPLIKDQ